MDKEDELEDLRQQKEEFLNRLEESENDVIKLQSKLGGATERVRTIEEQRLSISTAHAEIQENVQRQSIERESLMRLVNEKNSNISMTKGRIQEKEMNLSRLNDSSMEEDTISHQTNDSSRSGGSSKFSSFKASEPLFEDDEMKGLQQWRKWDEIPEEADEASSVGGDDLADVTP